MRRFEGLVAAAHTPFDARGALEPRTIPLQAEFLREQGNTGVFVCGSTGEGHSLSREERFAVAEGWAREVDDAFRLIVHVGANALPDCRALASHAASIGASAIACQAPCYERPRDVAELVAFLREVARAAPDLPFYYYDIPDVTGVRLPIVDVMREAAAAIPRLQGVKYTADDLDSEAACVECEGGRFEVLHGRDERLLDGLRAGCRAAVGSTYNYAARLYLGLFDLREIGDEIGARTIQERACRMIDLLVPHGVLRAGKAVMAMQGVDCGPPRLPASPLADDDERSLRGALDAMQVLSRPLS